jgi:hypothetical protein
MKPQSRRPGRRQRFGFTRDPIGVRVTAIRTVAAAEGKFVQISNGALQDSRLSYTARGILAYVLSLPPDHYLTSEWLESHATESRRVMRAALRELETCGYYRKTKTSGGRGTWVWDHTMSDAPMTTEDDTGIDKDGSSQVVTSDHHTADVNRSDVNRSDKELNTSTTKDEDQKMAQERASRRAQASGSRGAKRNVSQVIADIREAVAQVHGEDDADSLSDGQVLGLYFRYGHPKKPARDLVAYMTKILGDAPYLDTLMANVEVVCVPCWSYESACKCPVAPAA